MRISDWSSDVCSSDLPERQRCMSDLWQPLHDELVHWREAGLTPDLWLRDDDAIAPTPQLDHLKIGRASCRERVWQSVSNSVVAVSLKKKTIHHDTVYTHKTSKPENTIQL